MVKGKLLRLHWELKPSLSSRNKYHLIERLRQPIGGNLVFGRYFLKNAMKPACHFKGKKLTIFVTDKTWAFKLIQEFGKLASACDLDSVPAPHSEALKAVSANVTADPVLWNRLTLEDLRNSVSLCFANDKCMIWRCYVQVTHLFKHKTDQEWTEQGWKPHAPCCGFCLAPAALILWLQTLPVTADSLSVTHRAQYTGSIFIYAKSHSDQTIPQRMQRFYITH